jgi:hypothetical protein
MASKSIASVLGAAVLGLGISLGAPATPAEARVHIFLGAPGFYYGPGYYPGPYYGYHPRRYYGYRDCYRRKVRIKVWRNGKPRRVWVRRRVCY